MTTEELARIATEVARPFAEKIVAAYAASCVKHSDAYQEQPPAEDDFFAWLEGYDWA